MTSPSGDTKEPDPPELNRTDDFMTWSYHSGPLSKLYFSLRSFLGGLENSHMPSPAGRVVSGTVMPSPTSSSNDRRILRLLEMITIGEGAARSRELLRAVIRFEPLNLR